MSARSSITMITAHAGAEGTPANTLQSIGVLAACGADALEMDVRVSGRGLLLSHDPLSSGAGCVSLEEALRLLAEQNNEMLVNLDMKEEGLAEQAYAAAARCGMANRILFTGSICPVDERFLKNLPPQIWFSESQLLPDERTAPLESVLSRGHSVINAYYRRVDPAALTPKTAQHYSCWTLDDEEAITAFLRAGVRNITTRIPRRALALRAEIQG